MAVIKGSDVAALAARLNAAEEEGAAGLADDARDHAALGCPPAQHLFAKTAAKKAEFISDRDLSALGATKQGRSLMYKVALARRRTSTGPRPQGAKLAGCTRAGLRA